MRWWVVCLLMVSCASGPRVARDVAAAEDLSPGGLNSEEESECEGFDCKYFLAPCSLKEHSSLYGPSRSEAAVSYMSLKEESYLREIETLAAGGYCQRPPRKLPAETYNANTCIYVFIKKPECRRG